MSNIIKKIIVTNENGDQVEAQIDYQSLANRPDQLEYINTITATEDCRFLICDTDCNGNPIELKSATLFIRTHPAESSTTDSTNLYSLATLNPNVDFTENVNIHRINMLTSAVSRTEVKNTGCFFEVTAVEDETDEVDGRIAVFLGSPTLTTTLERNIPAGPKGICKVGIYASSTTCFIGKGSTVKIYGIRA
jgi:hypothetical protein